MKKRLMHYERKLVQKSKKTPHGLSVHPMAMISVQWELQVAIALNAKSAVLSPQNQK